MLIKLLGAKPLEARGEEANEIFKVATTKRLKGGCRASVTSMPNLACKHPFKPI